MFEQAIHSEQIIEFLKHLLRYSRLMHAVEPSRLTA
jgi:hypothetical protein